MCIKALLNVKSFASNIEFCCVTRIGELPLLKYVLQVYLLMLNIFTVSDKQLYNTKIYFTTAKQYLKAVRVLFCDPIVF